MTLWNLKISETENFLQASKRKKKCSVTQNGLGNRVASDFPAVAGKSRTP